MGAVFWRRRPGRLGALNGSGRPDGGRVGDGRSGRLSSSSSIIIEVRGEDIFGGSRDFCAVAAAKMFLLLGMLLAFAAAVRRGERERQAIDMGDGSTIWTSMGESNWVRARVKGVRLFFFGGVCDSTIGGESMERLLRSVEDGKSVSALVLTDEYWMLSGVVCVTSFGAFGDRICCCTSASTRARTSVSNNFCSRSFSIWTCLSISSRAFTSHSRRIVDSKAALILCFSDSMLEAFASVS